MSDTAYQVYVWQDDFLTDYSSGIAVAVARSLEEAKALVVANYSEAFLKVCNIPAELEKPYTVHDLPYAVAISGGG